MKLSSSNKNKINEFKRILPDIEVIEGSDLKEVQGTIDEVIIHKSLDAGKDMVVEDTILIVDGQEVVDIKWNKLYKTENTKKVSWIVSLGYNDGKNIYISRGIINGVLVEHNGVDGFGFDPYFLPDGSELTLAELEHNGIKDNFSARYLALLNLKNKRYIIKKDILDIEPWTGSYQNGN